MTVAATAGAKAVTGRRDDAVTETADDVTIDGVDVTADAIDGVSEEV